MDDFYGLTMEGACRALLLGHAGWDEPPGLYLAYREESHIRLSRTQLIEAAIISLHIVGNTKPTPGQILASVAASCLGWNVREAAPASLIGIALYSELYRVESPRADVADHDQIMAYARDRKLSAHPRAAQVREAWGLESGQPMIVLDMPRGGGQIVRAEKMAGGIPSGLQAIAHAVVADYKGEDSHGTETQAG